MCNPPECKSAAWRSHIQMPVPQAGECPRRNTPQGWGYKKFKRKECQNINTCYPLHLSNIKRYLLLINLISVEKMTCYKLLFRIKIIFHQGMGCVLDVSFVISGNQWILWKTVHVKYLLPSAVTFVCSNDSFALNWNQTASKIAILFQTKSRVLEGSLQLFAFIKGKKCLKWLQVCCLPVLSLPHLTYFI